MRVTSILSFFISASVSVSAFATKKPLNQYWEEAGMNLQFIEDHRVIRDTGCSISTAEMLGCVSALNVLGEVASPSLQIVPTTYLNGPYKSDFGAVVKTIGAFSIVQAIKKPAQSNASTRAFFQSIEKKRAAQIAAVEQLVKSGGGKDIENVYAYLKSVALPEARKKKLEPLTAASMYNAYIVQAQDAHGKIVPTAKFYDDIRDANQELIGIGAALETRPDQSIMVQNVKPGSPAEKGRLMPGDVIVAVDGVSTDGLSSDQVANKIRGKENTLVTLRLNRRGSVFEVALNRARVIIANVETRLDIVDAETKVGFIRLRSFMDKEACTNISDAITRMTAQGAKGFVLDLRENGGGLVTQATCISSLFVGRKLVVRKREIPTGNEEQLFGDFDQVTTLPTVVLINGNSASASELVSGALQDHSRAWIIGERSYGKGTVQQGYDYTASIMKYSTTARFHQPSGRTNQIHGIIPDIEVPARPGMTEDERFVPREKEHFLNALGVLGGPWVQTRPAEVAKLDTCMKSTGTAEKIYATQAERQMPTDYQVLKAHDAIRCLK